MKEQTATAIPDYSVNEMISYNTRFYKYTEKELLKERFDELVQMSGITKKLLLSNAKKRYLVETRMAITNILNDEFEFNGRNNYIGKMFNRDHASISYYTSMKDKEWIKSRMKELRPVGSKYNYKEN